MFVTLEGKGILRMATEEFMLSSRYKVHDPLAAEFIRTFREREFHGKHYLDVFDALVKQEKLLDMNLLLPKGLKSKDFYPESALYGFRSNDPDLFYLSPWEFVQWIKPMRLAPPSASYNWSMLTASGKEKRKAPKGATDALLPGVDYVVNDQVPRIRTEKSSFDVHYISKFLGAVEKDTASSAMSRALSFAEQENVKACSCQDVQRVPAAVDSGYQVGNRRSASPAHIGTERCTQRVEGLHGKRPPARPAPNCELPAGMCGGREVLRRRGHWGIS